MTTRPGACCSCPGPTADVAEADVSAVSRSVLTVLGVVAGTTE
ncbi:MAG: hypothetical protein WBC76_03765 [Actinomycetes bacterium]